MRKALISLPAFGLAALIGVPAAAGTLSCRSLNGNVTCSGSGAASCQTVDGRTVCTDGSGDVVQTFGGGHAPGARKRDPGNIPDDAPDGDEAAGNMSDDVPWTGPWVSVRRTDPSGSTLSLERRGATLRLRTDRLSVDVNRGSDPNGVPEP